MTAIAALLPLPTPFSDCRQSLRSQRFQVPLWHTPEADVGQHLDQLGGVDQAREVTEAYAGEARADTSTVLTTCPVSMGPIFRLFARGLQLIFSGCTSRWVTLATALFHGL